MNATTQPDNPIRIRVLVADDEAEVRQCYRDILQAPNHFSAGSLDDMRARLFGARRESRSPEEFDLTICSGAQEAVQAVRDGITEGRPYRVVFLDMRMPPGPDGLWAANRMRELDPLVDITVVTAFSDIDPEEISNHVPSADNIFYIQKPFLAQEIRQIASILGRRRLAEEKIQRLAYYDDITGLRNRSFFNERFGKLLESARQNGFQVALLFLDLDNFKRINDTLGHPIGNLLLNEVAKRLILNIRAEDLIERRYHSRTDNVARLGGDEFSLVLDQINQRADAALVAQRLLEALAEPLQLAGHHIIVTASIGIATFPDDGQDAETLIKNADSAMYFAKRQGRNAFQFYTQAMNADAIKRLTMENYLRNALVRNEFSLNYQPQVDVVTGAVSGVEALLRWDCTELKRSVSPAEFIPLAEETGQIIAIGEWVLRTACAQAKAWQNAGIPLPRICVNASVHQFAQNGFAAQVGKILQETGLEASALEIEITESVLMKNGDAALDILKELKSLGIQLAIDDFGTGYSSLAYLTQFPIDRLKIDRSFMTAVDIDSQEQAIVSAIIAMAKSMQLHVTAEGVETEGQAGFLKTRSCDEFQGYLFARPLPAKEVADFILRQSVPTPIAGPREEKAAKPLQKK
jgi:diguanylate cyclase (GGDEF)-like protein